MSAGVVQRIEFAPALMTRETVAHYLDCSLRDVDALRSEGHIIPVGTTKRIKFRKDDVDAYIESLPERDSEKAS